MTDKSFLKIKVNGKTEELVRGDFEVNEQYIKENRKNWMHITTHILAVLILLTFLFLLSYQILHSPYDTINMPDYVISIVSVVVGFYFARNLPL